MIKIVAKCKNCGRSMRNSFFSDYDSDHYTRFELNYCPHCIDLEDKIAATVNAKMIQTESKKKNINKQNGNV